MSEEGLIDDVRQRLGVRGRDDVEQNEGCLLFRKLTDVEGSEIIQISQTSFIYRK